jgi:hypothetical protein
MILNNAPVNEAIVSNVAEIGEFRIRNSAKAFSILSSGLYANKIRAIIRELSCNAVDSHTAAGKIDTPFDVHLPNQLDPYFSIRDYGTGLTHDQVTNIYTTYFESTKTDSNAFIGALGLGSKSPFSYTDNFTVTAIKDGKKGIYSAFINEQGVPSIALMMQEDTDEPAGVEVKFSVNDYYDYGKFRSEAQSVYKHFALKPVVSGCENFKIEEVAYERKDIIPGVHSLGGYSRSYNSSAVMGNISYPIDIPQADTVLGNLAPLLRCGLELHFSIGELDFQASREGLSYIPQTITSIKNKLAELNNALVDVLKVEADAIENLWERAVFLHKKAQHSLWAAASNQYAQTYKLETYDHTVQHYQALKKWALKVEDLAKNYNIVIRSFIRHGNSASVTVNKSNLEYDNTKPAVNGHYVTWQSWNITVDTDTHFVINDTKTGGFERAKYHYRTTPCPVYSRRVIVLDAADKSKDMKTDEFFKAICNPPEGQRVKLSSLADKPRASAGVSKNVSILKLERRGGRGYRRSEDDMVWRDASKLSAFDKTTKYYYVPLSGFQMISNKGYTSGKELYEDITSLPGLFNSQVIYGVRKGDIDEIKKLKNWINLEDHIGANLPSINKKFLMSVVKTKLESGNILKFSTDVLKHLKSDSPYAVLVNDFKNVEAFNGSTYQIERLFKRFSPTTSLKPDNLLKEYQERVNEISKRYPLIEEINTWRVSAVALAEYITLIDNSKAV